MGILHDKFITIKTLDDLRPFLSDTVDGESTIIEFKSIRSTLQDKINLGEQKALIAKEICAFLNSNDGILVWGAEKTGENTISILNNSNENLADLFDRNLTNLVEPAPAGIDYKIVGDNNGGSCLAIFIPHSDIAPHRVGNWKAGKEKDILGRYYGRSGSNSIPLPEGIIRAMYLSNGRIPRISIHTELEIINPSKVKLQVVTNPDPQRYVSQYYNSNQVAIITLDGNEFEAIKNDDGDVWSEIGEGYISTYNSPIYPKESEYELFSSFIVKDEDTKNKELDYENSIMPMPKIELPEIPHMDGNIHLLEDDFLAMYAIATKSNFACDESPLTTKTNLYIVGSSYYWGMKNYRIERVDCLKDLEQKFNVEIYIASHYKNDIRDDRESPEIGFADGKLRISELRRLLEMLSESSRD